MDEQQMKTTLHDLFCGMVCRKLKEAGLIPFLDCDPYEFATSLDMSFEEIMNEPFDEWGPIIDRDLEEFAKEVR